jgi:DNA-directed RNA polymerase subunit RPC12/RpoP
MEDGRPRFGLSPDDHEKIRQGYGCPNCLEDFTEHSGGIVVYAQCPVCKHRIDVNADFVETPRYWMPDPNDPDRN